MRTWIKICGITNTEDAALALDAGADAIGLNLVTSSKRRVDSRLAREIVRHVAGALEVVAVVADLAPAAIRALRAELGIDWLQLHGHESPGELEQCAPRAYKALRIAGPNDVVQAAAYGGERLLVDALVPGELGGTGHSFDWSLVRELATRRPLIVAGGLHAANVARAVELVRPFGVDVASGVELPGEPRKKDRGRLRDFVAAVRAADGIAG